MSEFLIKIYVPGPLIYSFNKYLLNAYYVLCLEVRLLNKSKFLPKKICNRYCNFKEYVTSTFPEKAQNLSQ